MDIAYNRKYKYIDISKREYTHGRDRKQVVPCGICYSKCFKQNTVTFPSMFRCPVCAQYTRSEVYLENGRVFYTNPNKVSTLKTTKHDTETAIKEKLILTPTEFFRLQQR